LLRLGQPHQLRRQRRVRLPGGNHRPGAQRLQISHRRGLHGRLDGEPTVRLDAGELRARRAYPHDAGVVEERLRDPQPRVDQVERANALSGRESGRLRKLEAEGSLFSV
jgi:hypothetical protein